MWIHCKSIFVFLINKKKKSVNLLSVHGCKLTAKLLDHGIKLNMFSMKLIDDRRGY